MEFIFSTKLQTEGLLLYQKLAPLQVFSTIFPQISNFCFPENLLVADANVKVLKIFVSIKGTVYMQGRSLRSEKTQDAQRFEWKFNCTEMGKYTCYFKHKMCCNIQQNLGKQFTLHQAGSYSEPFQLSKQGGYLLRGNYLHKGSILDV